MSARIVIRKPIAEYAISRCGPLWYVIKYSGGIRQVMISVDGFVMWHCQTRQLDHFSDVSMADQEMEFMVEVLRNFRGVAIITYFTMEDVQYYISALDRNEPSEFEQDDTPLTPVPDFLK